MGAADKHPDKMKWKLCTCEVSGLVRPTNGPLKIKETDVVHEDILKATLAGGASAHAVRVGKDYYFVDPKKEIRKVPADSLTDALHAGVFIRNEELKAKKKLGHKTRPMPSVDLKKAKKKS